MRKRWQVLVLVGCMGLQPLPTAAEETHTLAPIRVQAPRETIAERNVETVKLETETKAVVSTVPDALDKTAGLDVQRRSILTPKSSQVKIRGLEEKRSLIMLDGRPLNGTGVMGGQFVDWSVLSTGNWEAVDIGKGAFSAKYGNTLGGTINLVPAPPGETPEFSFGAGCKRYDTYSVNASTAGRLAPFGARVSGGYVETDGHLRNSEAERSDFAADLYYFWGDDGEVRASVRYTDGDFNMPVENRKDLPGYDSSYTESTGSYLIGPGISFPSGDRHGDDSYYTKKRTEVDLSVAKPLFGFDSELKLYFNNEDREDFIYSYEQGDKVLARDSTPDRSWGWVARTARSIGRHRIGFGGDGNYQGYGGTENTFVQEGYFPRPITDGDDEWDATRWQGAFVDDTWTVWDPLDLYVGLRYEDYHGDRTVDQVVGYTPGGGPAGFEKVTARFDEDVLLPKAGLVYRPLDGLSLYGRFARATRFPDNPAFYWYYGGYRPEVDPNSGVVRKDLTYEDALQYETGIRYSGIRNLSLGLNFYYYDVDDYIRWIFGYSPSRVVYNIDEVTFRGVEFDLEGRIWGGWSGFFNFTWQDTRKEGDVLDGGNDLSDELPELPEYKANLGIRYEREDGFLAKATLRWVDDREVPYLGDPGAPYAGAGAPDGVPLDSDVTLQKLDDFTVVDLLVRYPVWHRSAKVFVSGGVENLFDQEYEEDFGFPAPGQTFFISVEMTI